MVNEDDEQFRRFWGAYPYRVAKKEARIAWTQLLPEPALVDRMIATLAWQAPLWEKQGYGMPYPASWIRGSRWEDEPPAALRKANGHTTDLIEAWGYCFHEPRCEDSESCRALRATEKKARG